MVSYNRIMHAADSDAGVRPNEFFTVNASRVSELEGMGFSEVGRSYKLTVGDFEEGRSDLPKLGVFPVKRLTEIDPGLRSKVEDSMTRVWQSTGFDKRALSIEGLAEEIVSAVPVSGDLYIVDYTNVSWDTSSMDHKELFFLHPKDGKLTFSMGSPKKGLYLRSDSGCEHINPKGSMLAHYTKSYPLRINRIEKVGEMEIAPAFLKNEMTHPRLGSGNIEVGPSLLRYGDFEKYIAERDSRDIFNGR